MATKRTTLSFVTRRAIQLYRQIANGEKEAERLQSKLNRLTDAIPENELEYYIAKTDKISGIS